MVVARCLYQVDSMCTGNVEPSRQRVSGRSACVYVGRYIGKVDTVQEVKWRSPKSKLHEKSLD